MCQLVSPTCKLFHHSTQSESIVSTTLMAMCFNTSSHVCALSPRNKITLYYQIIRTEKNVELGNYFKYLFHQY
ncbi:hypothetical protein PRUPE_4G249400 [Prunus persica]|uniref:Uncharacterized protein n=1 Tax=Prunus persica TaxID=3760 RepID=A0A251PQR2_PRUPE|nr:hypothetical protein PRUPE_4G249400 [Prunus persica]